MLRLRAPPNSMDDSCDHPSDDYQPATSRKGSLDFIMNSTADTSAEREPSRLNEDRGEARTGTPPISNALSSTRSSSAAISGGGRNRQARSLTSEEKRRARECKVDGCENYIINKGVCFRHGGGKKCSTEGCQSSAKNSGLCWRHGGSVKCLMEGCDRRGKSRGLCWAHGGGTKCSNLKCSKVAVSNGFCWAHGGGKRCEYAGCKKAAYERTHNYCVKHHDQLKDGTETMDV